MYFAVRLIYCIGWFFFAGHVVASQESEFYNHVEWAKNSANQANTIGDVITLSDYCPDDDPSCEAQINRPSQAGMSDAEITSQSTAEYYSNDQAKAIQDNFDNNNANFDPNEYSRAVITMENAYEITHGLSNQYADCETNQLCSESIETQYCSIPTHNPVVCNITPYITNTTGGHQWVNIYPNEATIYDALFLYNATTSAPVIPTTVTHIIIPAIPLGAGYHNIFVNGILVKRHHQPIHSYLVDLSVPTNFILNSNPILVEISYNNGPRYRPIGSFWGNTRPMQLKVDTKKHEIDWHSSCGALLPDCKQVSYRCVEGQETRIWEGVSTTLPCWKYQATYDCQLDDTCGDLTDATILTQECSMILEGTCIEETIKKEVTVLNCQDKQLSCGIDTFCLDGECFEPQRTQSDSFDESAAALSALAEAAEGMGNPPRIFTGQGMKCTDAAFGFADCCKDGGWGTGIGIAQCNDEEEALGLAKEKGLTIPLGGYCAEKILGSCIRKKKTYCVYDSKLARIVQEQGTKDQLGVNLGSAKSPICPPLTPEQLQYIDFSLIDFSDFYEDMHNNTNLPSSSEIQDRLQSAFD
ncbi:type-F conjugative transfer system mating-pair stabilization protein TraN [Enterovibrio norvegicus]|uniref:Type-F conjugative transfer system mating-pair stabilization protein TraN n=1 Tax=Enterovibrio norvegicus TaxID=188144 RepID=A0ABV4L516_9GAMM